MKLSIITINYNNYKGLRKTIESVINQTWQEFEWIIVDGGSSDGSKKLIEEAADNCPNISYWCSEPDKGIYNAMNKGIVGSNGEYCMFMNSGDQFVDSEVLKKIFGLSFNEDIVYGYYLNLEKKHPEGFNSKSDLRPYDFLYSCMPHQATFFKTDLFKRVGLYDETLRVVGDRKFYIQAIIYGGATVRFIPIDIALTDLAGVSTSDLGKNERQQVLDEFFPTKVREDIMLATSLRDVLSSKIGKLLYSFVYRLSTLKKKK